MKFLGQILMFLSFWMIQGQNATVKPPLAGVRCSVSGGDEFTCVDSFFFQCDKDSSTWLLQNTCSGKCINESTFGPLCAKNAGNSTANPGTTTIGSVNQQTTVNNTNTTNQPPAGLSPFVIAVIVVCCVVAVGLGLFIFYIHGRKRTTLPLPKAFQRDPPPPPRKVSPLEILSKDYVCVKPYIAQREDELDLATGDRLQLELLYNDGWARAYNATSNHTGLVPVTHIQAV